MGSAFAKSLVALQGYDLRGAETADGVHVGGEGRFGYHIPVESGANIVSARNDVVRKFLDTPAEWLWMIDSDMAFEPYTLDQLLATADKTERPIVGGLCFARFRGERGQEIVPTVYNFNAAGKMVRWNGYPPDDVFAVGGTGAACLLVHRTVFETMRDARWTAEQSKLVGAPEGTLRFPPPWPYFQETITGTEWGDALSEDLTFCLRAGSCGFPIFVDSRIKIGHQKPVVIDEAMYQSNLPAPELPAPTYVVIPVKGKQGLTSSILEQLEEQEGFDQCFVYDNGAGTADAYATQDEYPDTDEITIIPATGMGIYEMWNAGIREALSRDERCNIVILNNDLELGDNFLAELTKGLRAHPSIAAVSANYDGRECAELVQAVRGIAAGREDGTGGLAGFAFAVRGELFASGFPMFDEQFEWYYGDTDFTLNLDAIGAVYGVARDAHCIHIGGGSQTSGDGQGHRLTPELAAAAERDRKRFEEKWSHQQVNA